jgi:hypothetical protein
MVLASCRTRSGIRNVQLTERKLDSGFRRNDEIEMVLASCRTRSGIRNVQLTERKLDSGFRRNDEIEDANIKISSG